VRRHRWRDSLFLLPLLLQQQGDDGSGAIPKTAWGSAMRAAHKLYTILLSSIDHPIKEREKSCRLRYIFSCQIWLNHHEPPVSVAGNMASFYIISMVENEIV
jgi:hypothetical protein